MSQHVPPSARRDLKAPAYLHLDEKERFPRMTVRVEAGRRACLFGPFRSPLEAGRAREALHKLYPLRPCDYVFEPDPALALGLGCIYAQIRTCSAPCLVRIGEDEYRSLAREATAFLAQPTSRSGAKGDCVPSWVAAAEDSRGIVAEPGPNGIELYPVRAGAVLEQESRVAAASEGLEEVLACLRWTVPDPPRDDWPWLLAWLNTRRRSGRYLAVGATSEAADLAGRLRAVLLVIDPPPYPSPRRGRGTLLPTAGSALDRPPVSHRPRSGMRRQRAEREPNSFRRARGGFRGVRRSPPCSIKPIGGKLGRHATAMKEYSPKRRTALVLTGSGTSGAYHAGALQGPRRERGEDRPRRGVRGGRRSPPRSARSPAAASSTARPASGTA